MQREELYFNGINGESGEYDIPPLTGEEFARLIQGEPAAENLQELRYRYQQRVSAHLGIVEGVNPDHLDQAGWGIIFTNESDPLILEALDPLLKLRRSQAGDYFHIYGGPQDGYRPGESKNDFLSRHGVGPGPANPEKLPYHLLIVGGPDKIPFAFQTQLDVQYSVGRIYFDTAQEYANYAASVVAAESPKVRLARKAAFFGVSNPDDAATAASSGGLVQPLMKSLASRLPEWEYSSFLAEQANRNQLEALLGGDPAQTPALLFSASHGMSFPINSPRQLPHQGALLCQDWPGPNQWKGTIPQDFYFAGDHLRGDVNLLGMVAFFFACYGAGTPQQDQFSKQAFKDRASIAPYPFLAQLPVKMLGLPHGGALAVIGHVERAWGYSFRWTESGQQSESFDSALRALLSGKTIGAAMEYFNERYAEISTLLSDELEEIEFGKKYDPYNLARMWTANNDARGYAILGDPAVRLPLAAAEEPVLARPEVVVLTTRTEPQSVPAIPAEPVQESASPPDVLKETVPQGPPATGKSFSIFGQGAVGNSLLDSMPKIAGEIQEFTARLVELLNNTVDDDSRIAIETYQDEKLIITTQLSLDGDARVTLHVGPGELDDKLLALHSQMVQQARAGQGEMLKAMSAAVAGLTGLVAK
jgi:hypothetical protein